jgi:rhomboid protease GluP
MCAANLINMLKLPGYWRTGWNIKFTANFTLLAIGLLLFPAQAGIVAGLFSGIFIIIPIYLSLAIKRSTEKKYYRNAYRLMWLLKYLHPLDGMRGQAKLLRIFEFSHQGEFAKAEQLLASLETANPKIQQASKLHLMQLRHDWQGIVELCSSTLKAHPSLETLSLYLRALGELGNTNEMLRVYANFKKYIDKLPKQLSDSIRFIVYAFSGECDALQKLFQGSMRHYSHDLQELWLATSEMTAGLIYQAQQRLASIKNSHNKIIERRLAFNLPVASVELTQHSIAILRQDVEVFTRENYVEKSSRSSTKPIMTYIIMLICCLVMLGETYFGGSAEIDTLDQLGAVIPPLVLDGEWWRLFTAQFLHFGWIHLVMNLIALQHFGSFVEREFGWFRFIGLYLLSGACAMLCLVMLTAYRLLELDLIVGASAGVMGLIGASTATFLIAWFYHRADIARKRLGSMMLIMVVQIAFDYMTPQISMAGHLSGFVFGFLIAMIYIVFKGRVEKKGVKG